MPGQAADPPSMAPAPEGGRIPLPKMGAAELAALHVRVIALENLVIALLAAVSDGQREQARDMASYISPRPGCTPHPLTTHAASHMVDLVERASRFSAGEPS